tara:strand:+ start:4646 stop:6283 length:1638 start_codon:yes stop_codon:yes gene_type:complete
MKTLLKFSSKTTLVCLCLGVFLTTSIVPTQAQVAKRDHRTKEKIQTRDHRTNGNNDSNSEKISFKSLDHFWNNSRTDNYSTATAISKSGALAQQYRFVRTDGYIQKESSNIEGQAVPLYLYYSNTRKDNFITATAEGIRAAEASGYRKVRIEGYVLKTVKPEYQHLYKPLWLYYHDTRKDNFTIATPEGMRIAETGGYRKVRIEGYIRILAPNDLAIEIINYLGQHPKKQDNNWSDRLQGVTHDANNWYFTQLTKLWKFPFSHDLAKKLNGPNPSQKIYQVKIPEELAARGYNHFCDLDFFDGYLFVPVEGPKNVYSTGSIPYIIFKNPHPYLLVYKASNLKYIGKIELSMQSNAGWCAIHPITKELYTSSNAIDHNNPTQKIHRYTIDFNKLKQDEVVIVFKDYFALYNESGSRKQDIKKYMQGGDFSEDGQYLYLVNGRASSDTEAKDGGVWVFNVKTGRKLTKSFSSTSDFNSHNNTLTSINENFKYEYHPGWRGEEPEGITVGNVNGKGAPNIMGQVHVILLGNNPGRDDDVYFKHYQVLK